MNDQEKIINKQICKTMYYPNVQKLLFDNKDNTSY